MSGAALLDAIYAAPHDATARAVYADWLLDRGDPRGELMQLQLRSEPTPEQQQRATTLVDEHAESWIGRLTEITTWIEFERGFLAKCGLASAPAWAVGMREWATVSHIGLSDDWSRGTFAPLIVHEVMRSLVSIRIAARTLTELLGTWERSRVTELVLDGSLTRASWDALGKQPMFHALAVLEVRGALEDPRCVLGSPLARVAYALGHWNLEWTRGDDDALSVLRAWLPKQRRGRTPDPQHLLRFLRDLPRDTLSRIAFDLGPDVGPTSVKDALERQVRVVDDL